MTMGKVTIITGAGTGIGKYTALALLDEGYSVVLAGRRAELLDAVVDESGAGERIIAVPTDVGDPQAVEHLFETTRTTFGRLDLLFNNAGSGAPAIPLEELTLDQWQRVVRVNLTGTFLCTQAAHEGPRSKGWSHYQQRLDFGACTSA